jgi:hypothetical protein
VDSSCMIEQTGEQWVKDMLAPPPMSLCRAIVGAAWPMPLAYGNTTKDILYLMPDKKSSAIVRDIPKNGRVLLAVAQQDEAWQTRTRVYKETSGAESAHGGPLWELFVRLESHNQSLPVEALVAHVKVFVDHCGQWRATLRPGCTRPVESVLIEYMSPLPIRMLSYDVLAPLEEAARKFELPEGKTLRTVEMR